LSATVPSGRAILRARAHLDAGRARVPSIDRSVIGARRSTIDRPRARGRGRAWTRDGFSL